MITTRSSIGRRALFSSAARRGLAPACPATGIRLFCILAVSAVAAGCAPLNLATDGHSGGERVAYHVWNDTGRPVIDRPTLVAPGVSVPLYANLQAYAPGWRWRDAAVQAAKPSGKPSQQSNGGAITTERVKVARVSVPDSGGRSRGELPRAADGPSVAVSDDPMPGNFDPLASLAHADDLVALPRPLEGAFRLAPSGHHVPASVRLSWRAPPAPGERLYRGAHVESVEIKLRSLIPESVIAKSASSWRYRLDIAIGANTVSPSVRWRLMRQGSDGAFEVRRSRGW